MDIKKRLYILLSCLVFMPLGAKAQFLMEFAYRTGWWVKPTAANYIVNDYNSIRTWLDPKMEHFTTGKGFRFVIGTQASNDRTVGETFNIQRMQTVHDAHGMEPSTGKMGYRRIAMTMGGFGAGFNISAARSEWFDWLIGLDANAAFYSVRTLHAYNADFSNADEDEGVVTSIHPTIGLYSRFAAFAGPVGIGITPMYEFAIFKADIAPLGTYLNSGYTNPNTLVRPSSFSILASFIFCPKHRGES